ncbi:hypothetical protein D3C85_1251130 [compost metagenome]
MGEQAHLAAGASAFALDARGGQGGFPANQRNEFIIQGIQLRGDCFKKLCATRCRQVAIGRVGGRGSLSGGVHFIDGGLHEREGQRVTGAGVVAV